MSTPRIAVFPGSFDPITLGHTTIVERASTMFDKIIVAIGTNSAKKYMFSVEQRTQFLQQAFAHLPHVEVQAFEGLTIDFCEKVKAKFILRGLRNSLDFQFEKNIAQMNLAQNKGIETVVLFTEPKYAAISSTIVRDIYRNNGDIQQFLPKGVTINKK